MAFLRKVAPSFHGPGFALHAFLRTYTHTRAHHTADALAGAQRFYRRRGADGISGAIARYEVSCPCRVSASHVPDAYLPRIVFSLARSTMTSPVTISPGAYVAPGRSNSMRKVLSDGIRECAENSSRIELRTIGAIRGENCD